MIGVLSYVHLDSCIPIPALLFNVFIIHIILLQFNTIHLIDQQAVVASFLVSSKTITNLIDFCVFAYWIFYVTAIVVLLILRKTRPDAPRPYRVTNFHLLKMFKSLPVVYLIFRSHYLFPFWFSLLDHI